MILKSLELQGFKSFPDKTLLEFDRGVTAVIGPNGSGKSNISDAVRWVLGEQSTKSLRGSRMEDVIFSGTGVRKAQGFAEVTLRLDNQDRSLQGCDRDDVSVTRKYYRSGESEYILNGETVRLRDIHELFMDTGLGRDGYSLVSQGRVADLVSSRSSQRRDMLEEAAGISHFRYRRSDATRRLDQAEENLVRLRDILTELEDRVGPLKKQSEKALQYLEYANEKKDVEIGLWLHTITKSKTDLKTQEDKLALATLQYRELEDAIALLAQQIEENISQGQAITVEIEQVRQRAAEYEEQATTIDGHISVEENTLLHNQNSIARITKDMEDAAGTQQHLDEQVTQAEEEISACEDAILQLNTQLDALQQQADTIRQSSLRFSDQTAALTQERIETAASLADKRVAQSTALSSAAEIRARLEAIAPLCATREQQSGDLQRQTAACQTEYDALRASVDEIQNALSGHQMLADTRRAKADKARQEIDAANASIQQKSARLRMLDDLEKNMEGYSGSVKAVMRETNRGTLSGIHGPISQLIAVEKQYTIAIETALGAAIQYIVTDTEQDAKRAIQHLQESRAGRATFLPLSAIRPRTFNERGVEECPGFLGMADKLVATDAQYADIISAQLARTAVVDNMDHAIAAARKYQYRFRIVTLDGQVLNAGGSMTGGSQSRSVGFLSRFNEIEALQQEIRTLKEALSAKQRQYQAIASEAAAAIAALEGSQADLQRMQETCIRKESALHLLQERLETSTHAWQELRQEQSAAAGRLQLLEQEDNTLQQEMTQLQQSITQLDAQLTGFADERQTLTARLEENAQQAAGIHLQLLEKQKDIQAKREAIDVLERRKGSHSGRISDLNEEIGEIALASIAVKEKIAALRMEAEALRKNSAQAKAQVSTLVEQRNAVEGAGSTLRVQERAQAATREGLSGELARLEERRDAIRNAMEDAQNQLYEEYQLTLREAQELNIILADSKQAQKRLQELKAKIRALGNVNVGAVEEYREVSERYTFLKAQIEDVEHSRAELLRLIQELTEKMSERFSEQFTKINRCFIETFTHLFGGGKAELVLEDPANILECPIEIRVQPPGKNVQNIDLLSGGEKGLSAIALLFAILKITPAPFCIFDEVEAALDDVNVSRYAQYVRHMTDHTQFILITHRRGTMEEADVLYGVTMQEEGVSKLLRLKTAEMAKEMGIA